MSSYFVVSPIFVMHPGVAESHAQDSSEYRARPLQPVIDALRAAGVLGVYSTNLLTSDLRVEQEPNGCADNVEKERCGQQDASQPRSVLVTKIRNRRISSFAFAPNGERRL